MREGPPTRRAFSLLPLPLATEGSPLVGERVWMRGRLPPHTLHSSFLRRQESHLHFFTSASLRRAFVRPWRPSQDELIRGSWEI